LSLIPIATFQHRKRTRRTPTQSAVLWYLALERPANSYTLTKLTKSNRSSVQIAVKNLVRDFLISNVRTILSRNRVRSKVYDLTIFGLLTVLSNTRQEKIVARVAEKHAEKLPLILGKWPVFIESHVDPLALKILNKMLKIEWSGELRREKPGTKTFQTKLAEEATMMFYLGAADILDPDELKKWVTVFKIDKEIADKFLHILTQEEDWHRRRANEFQKQRIEIAQSLQPNSREA